MAVTEPVHDFYYTDNKDKKYTATQLCVINSLQGKDSETKRRLSQVMPLERQSEEILQNYGSLPPSLSYHCDLKGKNKRFYYWKNLLGVSLGVLCLLAAYDSLFYVQSSLNSANGLGSLALAVDYGCQVFACLVVPALLIEKVGCKWTLVLSMFGVSVYIAANFYPTFGTLIPAASIMGIGFATMWATMNAFVSELATGYARLEGMSTAVVTSRFFGIMYMTIQTAKIWGNLISSQVLAAGKKEITSPDKSQLAICGAAYCNQKFDVISSKIQNFVNNTVSNNSTIANGSHVEVAGGVSSQQVQLLCGISLAIAIFAMLFVAASLNSSKKKVLLEEPLSSRIFSTVRLLGNKHLLLLALFTIDAGLVQSFFVSDFTKAFMTCGLGIEHVGLVTMCYGVTAVIGCIFMGYLAQWVGRQSLMILAALLNIGDLLIMLWWHPDPNNVVMYYVISGIWGIALSVWLTQLTALYGFLFPTQHEEAYSNHRMLECIGFVMGFVWEQQICMKLKIYIILGMLIVGLISYILLEISLWRIKRKNDVKLDMH